jgi:adenosylcobinamide-GDP ribazoletransferase
MKALAPFLVAVQFLTRFPIPSSGMADQRTSGRSLIYYPLVGLMLGAVLASLNYILAFAPDLLRAALLLAVWVIMTGALHLDGLADSADAWIGGIGNRTRTLSIMKDPHCGPAAVVALVVLLLVKFAALHAVASNGIALAIVPMLARTSVVLLFLTTPYVRKEGLGAALATNLPKVSAVVASILAAAVTMAFLGSTGFAMLVATIAAYAILRAMMKSRIGGTTGDTAGALIEISEAGLLVTIALAAV